MKRIHVAIAVANIDRSVEDYSRRLGAQPSVVVPDDCALWLTPEVIFSIRMGWEDEGATQFGQDTDVNGIAWERFSRSLQVKEIEDTWPGSTKEGDDDG